MSAKAVSYGFRSNEEREMRRQHESIYLPSISLSSPFLLRVFLFEYVGE